MPFPWLSIGHFSFWSCATVSSSANADPAWAPAMSIELENLFFQRARVSAEIFKCAELQPRSCSSPSAASAPPCPRQRRPTRRPTSSHSGVRTLATSSSTPTRTTPRSTTPSRATAAGHRVTDPLGSSCLSRCSLRGWNLLIRKSLHPKSQRRSSSSVVTPVQRTEGRRVRLSVAAVRSQFNPGSEAPITFVRPISGDDP